MTSSNWGMVVGSDWKVLLGLTCFISLIALCLLEFLLNTARIVQEPSRILRKVLSTVPMSGSALTELLMVIAVLSGWTAWFSFGESLAITAVLWALSKIAARIVTSTAMVVVLVMFCMAMWGEPIEADPE